MSKMRVLKLFWRNFSYCKLLQTFLTSFPEKNQGILIIIFVFPFDVLLTAYFRKYFSRIYSYATLSKIRVLKFFWRSFSYCKLLQTFSISFSEKNQGILIIIFVFPVDVLLTAYFRKYFSRFQSYPTLTKMRVLKFFWRSLPYCKLFKPFRLAFQKKSGDSDHYICFSHWCFTDCIFS